MKNSMTFPYHRELFKNIFKGFYVVLTSDVERKSTRVKEQNLTVFTFSNKFKYSAGRQVSFAG